MDITVELDGQPSPAGPPSDPTIYLVGSIKIAGQPHRLILIRVNEYDEADEREGVDYTGYFYDNLLDDLRRLCGVGRLQTTTIDGQSYVAWVEPHAA